MQPVVRALQLLTVLAEQRGGLTLQELAVHLDLPLSTVHRLARVLESERFLTRTPKTRHFLPGPAVRALVTGMSSNYVRRVAEPTIAQLNRTTGETVFLAELVGREAVCFSIREGTRPLRLFVQLGRQLPFHASAAARVLLASLDRVTWTTCSRTSSSQGGPGTRSPTGRVCWAT